MKVGGHQTQRASNHKRDKKKLVNDLEKNYYAWLVQ